MTRALDPVLAFGVVPVVTVPDAALAGGLADALVTGGLPVAEITLRTPAGIAAIRELAGRSDVVVGAGTVTTVEQVELVHDAGGRFAVSPGLDAAVVRRCAELGLPMLPGVATASEIQAALALGVDVLKLFPAEPAGGLPLVRALAAPFPRLRFVPTGGIRAADLPAYLGCSAVAAVGGSWLVTAERLAARDWEGIAQACREAVTAARAARPSLMQVRP